MASLELYYDSLRVFPDDATAGHLGFHNTDHSIKSQFWWRDLTPSVIEYVPSRVPYQIPKFPMGPFSGIQHPLPCPFRAFEVVSITWSGHLLVTPAGHRSIVTTVQLLTCYAKTAAFRTGSSEEVTEFVLHSTFLRHVPYIVTGLTARGGFKVGDSASRMYQSCNQTIASSYFADAIMVSSILSVTVDAR